MARCSGDGIGALVEHVRVRRAGPGRVQAEPAEKAEAVQHLSAPRQVGHALVVHLLVEVQTGFVAAQDIHIKPEAVEINRHRAFEAPR